MKFTILTAFRPTWGYSRSKSGRIYQDDNFDWIHED